VKPLPHNVVQLRKELKMNDLKTNEEKSTLTTADLAAASQAQSQSKLESTQEHDESAVAPDRSVDMREQSTAVTEPNATKEPLIPDDGSRKGRWEEIQAHFVDEPKKSVEEADGLVAEVIQQLASKFAEERSKLESQWQGGGEASTEDLRLAMQHYRDFFQRLLAA
jgi:hypothetical protein